MAGHVIIPFLFIIQLFLYREAMAQPAIQSFSPLSAVPGSTITISGSGFSTTPAANIVYFGAVKATVTSATPSTLQVTLPAGATPAPISVTVSGLTGYSCTEFQPRFGTVYPIDGSTFAADWPVETSYYPRNALFSDLNEDGKPDMLVLRYEPNNIYTNHIMPFRNMSPANGVVSLEPQGSFAAGILATDLAIADFDGDGKQDAVTASIGGSYVINVLRNISTSSIKFAGAQTFSTGGATYHLATGDADGDGRIDIVASRYLDGKLMIFRNTSSPGSISFAEGLMTEGGISPGMMAFADFNGDGKPDIAVANELFKKVVFLRNTGSPGSVSFVQQAIIDMPDNLEAENITAADLNADGQNDLVITTGDNPGNVGHLYAYRNAGNFSFVNDGAISGGGFTGPYFKPAAGDVNGDGKPDLVVGWANAAVKFGVYQNQSLPGGVLTFATPRTWYAGTPTRMAIGDLNADGQPELAAASINGYGVGMYKNKLGKLTISNVTPSTAGQGAEITITGYNLTGITGVKFGNTDAASFREVSPDTLVATVGTGTTGRVQVNGQKGTDYWYNFTYSNAPQIDSFLPKMAGAGDTVVIRGKNFMGTFAVKFGEVPAAWFTVVNPTTIKAIPGNGNHGNVSVQNSEGYYMSEGFIFLRKPLIGSYGPTTAFKGQWIYIYGQNLGLPGIAPTETLGGVAVEYVSSGGDFTTLMVVVGNGASGHLKVSHPGGSDSIGGFVFIPPPVISSVNPLTAGPGDTVMVKGANFTGLTGFFFGDSAAASFSVLSDSSVMAVVAHGKTGTIRATRPSGTAQFPGFLFVPLPPPVIESMSPAEGVTGTLVEVTGDNFLGILSIKMGTTPVRRYTLHSRQKISFYVPIGANGPLSITTYYGTATLNQPVFTLWLPPVLQSFSPFTAEPGETVTLTGSGFGTNENGIQVYFGQVQAKILQVQPNAVTVQVPAAAGYDFIRVTVRNLTAVSARRFNRSNHSTAGFSIKNNLFEITHSNISGGIAYDPQTITTDFNNDGLPDLAAFSSYNGVVVYKNISQAGKPAFESVSLPSVVGISRLQTNDVDGDGKTDLMLMGNGMVLRNISTGASIAFEMLPAGLSSSSFLADMNEDGKTDLVMAGINSIRIILNNSAPGIISFKDTLDVPVTGGMPFGTLLGVGDLDMDGAEDIIGAGGNYFHLLRNTGTPTQPAFAAPLQSFIVTGVPAAHFYYPEGLTLADLNMDGKPDLIVKHNMYSTASFAIYRNKSTHGNIVLGAQQLIENARVNINIQAGDFNGDNKPDLMCGEYTWLDFFQNNSTADSIMLLPKVSISGGTDAAFITDMDADGKTDVVALNTTPILLRNRLNEPQQTIICPNGTVTLQAGAISTGYQWQMDSGSGFTDLVNDAIVSGAQTAALTLTTVPSSWLKQSFRCRLANGSYGEPWRLEFSNTWKPGGTSDWHTATNWTCGVVPDGNTIVTIPVWATVELKSNGSCRSIFAGPYAKVTVAPGVRLEVTSR